MPYRYFVWLDDCKQLMQIGQNASGYDLGTVVCASSHPFREGNSGAPFFTPNDQGKAILTGIVVKTVPPQLLKGDVSGTVSAFTVKAEYFAAAAAELDHLIVACHPIHDVNGEPVRLPDFCQRKKLAPLLIPTPP